MALLICVATAKELAAIAPTFFPDVESIEEMRPMSADLRHGKGIFLATGVGPINAALGMGFCLGLTMEKSHDADASIDAVLCIGIAGAFDLEKTPLCSIWQVSQEIWPEYGLNDGTSVTARAFSFPLWARKGKEDIYDRLSLADISTIEKGGRGHSWPKCSSLTVAGTSASFARRDHLASLYHAELENMEGFAVAYAAVRAEIPCAEVRVVSNKVGPRSRDEKDFDGAMKTLGKILPCMNLI